ncbi:hypothetical protein [Streptomyces sp. NPDC021212]|uniref:hypothetical protein n=1 Tax=Streptomyces sp. NPDC021212 TaxID=3365118 RepID=UPI00378E1450
MTVGKHDASGAGDAAAAAAEPAAREAPAAPAPREAEAEPVADKGAESAPAPAPATATASAPEASRVSRTEEHEGANIAETATAGGPGPSAGTPGPARPPGGPRRPVLAGAAIVGALLLAVPLLVVAGKLGSSEKDGRDDSKAATKVLEHEGARAGEYEAASPEPSRSPQEKPKSKESTASARPPAARSPLPSKGPKSAKPTNAAHKPSPQRTSAKPKDNKSVAGSTGDAAWGPNSELCMGASWPSRDGRTELRMQQDGNLVVYRDGQPVWAAPDALGRGNCATLQTDGNFVLYDRDHNAVWATGRDLHATSVKIQNDGNFCLYNDAGAPVWASRTQR